MDVVSCRQIDREDREAAYDDFVKLEEARERAENERLNALRRRTLEDACPICGRVSCPSRKWFPEMDRFGTCPDEHSCRLTAA